MTNKSPVAVCKDAAGPAVNEAPDHVLWQWFNRAAHATGERERRPWKALEYARDGDSFSAFQIMENGQDHNTNAIQIYRAYRQCVGDFAFWHMVASVSSRDCDLAEAKINLDWQLQNNPESIMKARSYRDQPNANNAWTMAWLLSGQGHNQPVQDLYRACFATQPTAFLTLF